MHIKNKMHYQPGETPLWLCLLLFVFALLKDCRVSRMNKGHPIATLDMNLKTNLNARPMQPTLQTQSPVPYIHNENCNNKSLQL